MRGKARTTRRRQRYSRSDWSVGVAVYGAVAALLLVFTVLIPATGVFDIETRSGPEQRAVEGVIRGIEELERLPLSGGGTVIRDRVDVEIKGEVVSIERTRREGDPTLDLSPGAHVVVEVLELDGQTSYFIRDHNRQTALWLLALLFVAVVLIVGRWQGVASLIGLAASLLVLVRFVLPAILSGVNPLAATVLGAVVILATTLFLAHGVNWKTGVALGGTALSLVLTALLATVSVDIAQLSGIAEDAAVAVLVLSEGQIDARGLLLGGIIIGALGVLDDVTVGQSSTVFELKEANRDLSRAELYRRAMNVGRDHIASTVNTLVLAYAGAGLPLLVLLAAGSEPAGIVLSRDLVATEVVRTLVGSIGIVAAVPLTTALAALAATQLAPREPPAPFEGWERRPSPRL